MYVVPFIELVCLQPPYYCTVVTERYSLSADDRSAEISISHLADCPHSHSKEALSIVRDWSIRSPKPRDVFTQGEDASIAAVVGEKKGTHENPY